MTRLKPLQDGATIGIAAPSGPFDRRRFHRGLQYLRKSGFKVFYRQDIFSRNGYLAGSDERRTSELKQLLTDPRVKLLLFARGGYGCLPILPTLGRISPKIIVGSSDLTVLLATLWKRYRLPTLYGPMLVPHLRDSKFLTRFLRSLKNPGLPQVLTAREVLNPGRARGRLLGGCLTLVTSLIGTPYDLETRNAILFLEDTEEPPYAVDRMLTQLVQSGKLEGVKGIVLGTFRQKKRFFPSEIREVVRKRLRFFKGPILWGVRFGHCPRPAAIPFGGIGRIEGNRLVIQKGIFDVSL